jgi:hypothetical protein
MIYHGYAMTFKYVVFKYFGAKQTINDFFK